LHFFALFNIFAHIFQKKSGNKHNFTKINTSTHNSLRESQHFSPSLHEENQCDWSKKAAIMAGCVKITH